MLSKLIADADRKVQDAVEKAGYDVSVKDDDDVDGDEGNAYDVQLNTKYSSVMEATVASTDALLSKTA